MTTLSSRITAVRCFDDHTWIVEHQGDTCPRCGGKWRSARFTTSQRLQREAMATPAHFQAQTFKPYKEQGFTGKGIQIDSKGQREALCAKHGLSYDGCAEASKPNTPPAIDSINAGDLKAALEDPDFLSKDGFEPDLPDAPEEVDPDE